MAAAQHSRSSATREGREGGIRGAYCDRYKGEAARGGEESESRSAVYARHFHGDLYFIRPLDHRCRLGRDRNKLGWWQASPQAARQLTR